MNITLREKARKLERDLKRNLARIAIETGEDRPERQKRHKSKLPGDSRSVRGIPAFMSGERGAVRGSSPEIDGLRRVFRAQETNARIRELEGGSSA